ncbi:MAG: hydantoinase B/oxoprolinase family protein [Anaerolineae bacterium]|nr:hydantoinase B/oxoprolinase family protein [Anaerolineales bacterium]MCQ3977100.1 hydantoinase B/oxoprolinase family protein [Anaerolineae bacterium]
MNYDPILLELFKNRFASIAEEMGMALRRTAYSPNIKERLDFSCALFDAAGQMIAQAAHIPVHLGAMPISVATAIEQINFAPGDVVILNDPFRGGSHLPDITMIAPIFLPAEEEAKRRGGEDTAFFPPPRLLASPPPFAFVANRAHHADVGGMTPGSMPLSQEIFQEGIIIPPLKLVEAGQMNQGVLSLLLANVRTPEERAGDLRAQLAANAKGVERMLELVAQHGQAEVSQYMAGLLAYAERMTRALIMELPNGQYNFEDFLDDDGLGSGPVKIAVTITLAGDKAVIDFSGSAAQVRGSVNTVYAVTLSAVLYMFRALIGLDIPANSGCLAPLTVIAPAGTVVNARPPAAVAGGNVETSQRIVDVLLGALAQASPERVPAAAQGTMNNMVIGGWDPERRKFYTYYETIGGGMGAGPHAPGGSALQCHMTNTLNTPIEALEYAYPFLMRRYEIRRGSGGAGLHRGGDGIRREVKLLREAQVTLLTERRRLAPFGLDGGEAGQTGRNILVRTGQEIELPGKTSQILQSGDVLRIETPGGGGYGRMKAEG